MFLVFEAFFFAPFIPCVCMFLVLYCRSDCSVFFFLLQFFHVCVFLVLRPFCCFGATPVVAVASFFSLVQNTKESKKFQGRFGPILKNGGTLARNTGENFASASGSGCDAGLTPPRRSSEPLVSEVNEGQSLSAARPSQGRRASLAGGERLPRLARPETAGPDADGCSAPLNQGSLPKAVNLIGGGGEDGRTGGGCNLVTLNTIVVLKKTSLRLAVTSSVSSRGP